MTVSKDESDKLKEMRIRFPPKKVLFNEGDTTLEMYILLSGKVEILKNNKRIAIVEGTGSYIGELSTLLGAPRTATVRTIVPCDFIVVDGDKVAEFFTCSPQLGLKLAKMLADRLAKMNVGYVKLEQRNAKLSAKLEEANEKLKTREKQITQLVDRINEIEMK